MADTNLSGVINVLERIAWALECIERHLNSQ